MANKQPDQNPHDRPVLVDPPVVLVDENDHETGVIGKLAAHQDGGMLHRAFSIFIFHVDGRVLLQHRSPSKYHFGGLWTNACCGHAAPGELLESSATLRLWQEMRISAQLTEVGTFQYTASDVVSGLTEREIDHVFIATTVDAPTPDPTEADDWKWITLDDLDHALTASPSDFTPWLPRGLEIVRLAMATTP